MITIGMAAINDVFGFTIPLAATWRNIGP